MRKQAIQRRRLPLILLALPLLNGCLVHTRIVKRAKMPSVVMSRWSRAYAGVITISFFAIFARKSSPTWMCSSTRREGVCASHSASEISS
jgi:hypothetical protein